MVGPELTIEKLEGWSEVSGLRDLGVAPDLGFRFRV
jgi:hypothetical protein